MGDENAELGIALAQSKASGKRLSEKDGLKHQQSWNASYFNDRIAVYLFALCLFAMLFVWLVDVSPALRIAVTLATFCVGIHVIVNNYRNKKRTGQLRESQVRNHSRD